MFKGKCIYNPSGKAGEYSYWACNFYVGCSNGCKYCYCKKGIIAKQLGGDKPTLKKCFKDEKDAMRIFAIEVNKNLLELKEHGLFFTFTTDPFLSETCELYAQAALHCTMIGIPVKFLTKNNPLNYIDYYDKRFNRKFYSFGFTLTGHDELEVNAKTNSQRIESMKSLHDLGFKTFASIEPIIDFDASLEMIYKTVEFCDLYKIGLESGKKYDKEKLLKFVNHNVPYILQHSKIYWKDSILKAANIKREDLPKNCVNRDFNIFKDI